MRELGRARAASERHSGRTVTAVAARGRRPAPPRRAHETRIDEPRLPGALSRCGVSADRVGRRLLAGASPPRGDAACRGVREPESVAVDGARIAIAAQAGAAAGAGAHEIAVSTASGGDPREVGAAASRDAARRPLSLASTDETARRWSSTIATAAPSVARLEVATIRDFDLDAAGADRAELRLPAPPEPPARRSTARPAMLACSPAASRAGGVALAGRPRPRPARPPTSAAPRARRRHPPPLPTFTPTRRRAGAIDLDSTRAVWATRGRIVEPEPVTGGRAGHPAARARPDRGARRPQPGREPLARAPRGDRRAARRGRPVQAGRRGARPRGRRHRPARRRQVDAAERARRAPGGSGTGPSPCSPSTPPPSARAARCSATARGSRPTRRDRGLFIRSTAAGERLGGLAPATRAAAQALAAAFDVVVIETVGVGQSETEVAEAADTDRGRRPARLRRRAAVHQGRDHGDPRRAGRHQGRPRQVALRARRDLNAALRSLGERDTAVVAVSSVPPPSRGSTSWPTRSTPTAPGWTSPRPHAGPPPRRARRLHRRARRARAAGARRPPRRRAPAGRAGAGARAAGAVPGCSRSAASASG